MARYCVSIHAYEYIASYDCKAATPEEAIAEAREAIGEDDWIRYGGRENEPVVLDVDNPPSYMLAGMFGDLRETFRNRWEQGLVYKSGGYHYSY